MSLSFPPGLPIQDMLTLSLSALGFPVPHLDSGREARREAASRVPATVRGNEEKQLQAAPEARPGKTLQLELTQRTFQTLQPRCPVSIFFKQLLG